MKVGGGQICLCVAFFGGEEGKHTNEVARNLKKCRDSPGIIP